MYTHILHFHGLGKEKGWPSLFLYIKQGLHSSLGTEQNTISFIAFECPYSRTRSLKYMLCALANICSPYSLYSAVYHRVIGSVSASLPAPR